MSSSNRTTSKGGKGAKAEKSHKTDGGKSGEKGHNKENTMKNEELSIKEKVKKVIELTCRSEDEVCLALHENDNDIQMAVNFLFEETKTGEWLTQEKKKKPRQTSTSGKSDKKAEDGTGGTDDWDDVLPPITTNSAGAGDGKEWKDRGNRRDGRRGGDGGPPRMGRGGGWREDGERGRGDRRGGRGGSMRGGGGGRGRGGGRGGRFPSRGSRGGSGGGYRDYNRQQPIDTWDSSNTWDNSTATQAPNHTTSASDDWDDIHTDEWSTEEYTGSLVETKVFTPSVQPIQDEVQPNNAEPNLNQSTQEQSYSQSLNQSYTQPVQQLPTSPVPPIVGSLTAAQTQYFSQLQQNSDKYGNATYPSQQPAYNSSTQVQANYYNNAQYGAQQSYGGATTAQGSNYGGMTYGATEAPQAVQTQQPQRTKTRARVPPPSKIPASAVEMPGDLNSSITYLDVQFGAMDLMESSFESNTTSTEIKFASDSSRGTGLENSRSTPTSGLELTTSNSSGGSSVPIDATSYAAASAPSKNGTQSSISTALTQGLSNNDSIPQTSEHLSYNNSTSGRNTSQGTSVATTVPSVTSASNLDMSKQTNEGSHSYSSQTASYNSYQSKTNAYNSSPYTNSQTTASSYVNPSANTYVNNQANSYPNNAANANSYSYQSVTQSTNSYQNAQPSYASSAQNSQSVYGANANYTSTNQYNSYNSSAKMVKENSYDGASNASVAVTNSASTAASTAAMSSLAQTTNSSSKATATLAKNSTSVMSNIPPGVTPVMSTPYIMGQVPFYQPPVYSYEDMQMLQQRLPHMTTPYYDMGYQTPTTMATVRDPTGGALGGYGAAAADARFQTGGGRAGDGTTSPVPAAAAASQQQQQPILAAGGAVPYYLAPFNTIPAPNYAQYGATMYTQLPAVTNAHGSSASNQYVPKPTTYGTAGYGAYDALGQSQDYTKGGYVSTAAAAAAAQQVAQKNQGNSTSGGSNANDLSAMYGKSHAALGKVNSYEKQGFHSGTPPPFTGALSQNAGLAPSGTGYAPQVYIPAMPQHHSTMAMHQPLHQDSGPSSGQRSQGSNQAKSGSKQGYGASYWNQN